MMDLNCEPRVSEATALPTEPQPLPIALCLWVYIVVVDFIERNINNGTQIAKGVVQFSQL